jgi:tetratricopeptide (TPR) repeat protein
MAFGGENAESYHDEGLTAMMKGDLTRAVQFFTRAIQLDESYLAAFHQLGRCHLRLGQAQRAVEILTQVLSHKPDLIPARLDLAHASLMLGYVDAAQDQLKEVLTAQPDNWRANLGLAQVCFHKGKWDNAVTLAKAARAQGGANFATLFLLGRAARLAGDHMLAEDSLKAAETLIEKSVELSPDTPEGHYLRGEVSLAQERISAALEHFRAAEDRADAKRYYTAFGENFTRLDIMAKRALCLQRLGSVEGARELGKQIVAANPHHQAGRTLANL